MLTCLLISKASIYLTDCDAIKFVQSMIFIQLLYLMIYFYFAFEKVAANSATIYFLNMEIVFNKTDQS